MKEENRKNRNAAKIIDKIKAPGEFFDILRLQNAFVEAITTPKSINFYQSPYQNLRHNFIYQPYMPRLWHWESRLSSSSL